MRRLIARSAIAALHGTAVLLWRILDIPLASFTNGLLLGYEHNVRFAIREAQFEIWDALHDVCRFIEHCEAKS